MNIESFSKKFTDVFKEIDETDLLWDDDISYFFLYNQLNTIVSDLEDAQPDAMVTIFNTAADGLIKKIKNYKNDLSKCSSLSNDQITRLVAINRIEFLFYQQMHQMKNNMDSVHFLLADKMIQGALITGLNGPYHQLFLDELLNHERLVQVIDDFSKTKPVLEKYGKTVSNDQKKLVSTMKTQEVFNTAAKVFNETPVQFLARIPEYKAGFLSKIS